MSLLHSLRKGFFPSQCQLCQTVIDKSGLCQACHTTLPHIVHDEINLLTRPDINRMFHLPYCDGLSACAWYQGAMSNWLKQVKYHNNRVATKVLRQLITTHWHTTNFARRVDIDACILVPLANTRLIFRGYNQVYQTWAPLLTEQRFPMLDAIGKRATRSQVNMTKHARTHNVMQAYFIKHSLTKKRILLIDDVITTGATINCIAALCKAAGASQVWAYATCLTEV
ncbi:ComF family protein [Pseudoalteromonas sp. SMS1]|uniref:ComF family protein n=1 Tax=Pseudoalteromonas sp. SMS1 TaxID=2908894 RepID=UPI001F27B4FF|nr:ComF family protein [Pseudoalteromonas sp. SMS1]MCF2859612.1 ComF family protein [Pseudoalteromonas sp. SMS1]